MTLLPLQRDLPSPAKKRVQSGLRFSGLSVHCVKAALMLSRSSLANDPLHPDTPHLMDDPRFERWLQAFSQKVRVNLEVEGDPIDFGFVVGNHVSWLDSIVLSHVRRYSFVAKSEVSQWPVVGRFSRQMKTVFIERQNKFSVYRSLPILEQFLQVGRPVFVFPEGTTSTSREPLKFHPMLFEAAVRTRVPVQAVAIQYLDEDGQVLDSVGFVDDDSVFDTLFRMLETSRIRARLSFKPPLCSLRHDRKQLAQASRHQIAQALCA